MGAGNIQNATGMRRGWSGGSGGLSSVANVGTGAGIWRDTLAGVANLKSLTAGPSITITPAADSIGISLTGGTDYYLPFWLSGALTGTSPLKFNALYNSLTFTGASSGTIEIKTTAAGDTGALFLTCVGDSRTAALYFISAGILGSATYLAAPHQLNIDFGTDCYLTSGTTGYQLKLLSGLVTLRQMAGQPCNFTVQSDIANQTVNLRLRNEASASECLVRYTPTGSPVLDIMGPRIIVTAASNLELVTPTATAVIDATDFIYTKTGTDSIVKIVAATTARAQLLQFINTADAKVVELNAQGGNLTIIVPASFAVQAVTAAQITSYTVSLTSTGTGMVFFNHPVGLLVINSGGQYNMSMVSAGTTIFGPPDAYLTPLTNAWISVFAPTGYGPQNSIHIKCKDTATIGAVRASADTQTKYTGLATWGSGVGAGYIFGGVAALNAGALVGYDVSTLAMYTLATGAGYIPLAWGQSASGGDREVMGIDASGNFWIAYTSPLLFGKAAVTGTRRINKATAAGEINFERWSGAAWVSDISTYQSIGAGTDYTLTSTYAAVAFGTTSPSITIDRPGTYLIILRGGIKSKSTGSFTGKTGPGFWSKLYRTNNTPADITEAFCSVEAEDFTTGHSMQEGVLCPPAIYTTQNTTDIISYYAKMQTTVASGTFSVYTASITAVRLR